MTKLSDKKPYLAKPSYFRSKIASQYLDARLDKNNSNLQMMSDINLRRVETQQNGPSFKVYRKSR